MRQSNASRNRPSSWRRPLAAAALLTLLWGLFVTPGPAHASEQWLDIDITNQVLSEVVDGQVVFQTRISSGNGEEYWQGGQWHLAETPRGVFEVYAKDPGWVEAELGFLYNALYFYGGFAIHGSNFVPPWPDSHGCVRVTVEAADLLFERIPIGTPVVVHD